MIKSWRLCKDNFVSCHTCIHISEFSYFLLSSTIIFSGVMLVGIVYATFSIPENRNQSLVGTSLNGWELSGWIVWLEDDYDANEYGDNPPIFQRWRLRRKCLEAKVERLKWTRPSKWTRMKEVFEISPLQQSLWNIVCNFQVDEDNGKNDIERKPWMNEWFLEICGLWDTDSVSGNWEQQSHHP